MLVLLIIGFIYNGRPTLTTATFHSVEACETAANTFSAKAQDVRWALAKDIVWICSPDQEAK